MLNIAQNKSTNNLENFKLLLGRFYHLAGKQNIKLRKTPETTFLKFSSHDEEQQKRILTNFADYVDIYSQASNNLVNFKDEQTLLWYAIKKWNMRPTSDLMNHIHSTDIVEIYDSMGIQIFRNFNFFEISSYSVGEILTYGWPELYDRDSHVTNEILTIATQLFQGKHRSVIPSTVPDHNLEEVFSESKYTLLMKQKFYAPLFTSSGQVGAAVATCEVQIVEKIKSVKPHLEVQL